jgi:RimJ/RimL family protein N-acetyltransferase
MITITRTFDDALIKKIVTHPEVYPWLSDDGSPAAENWQPTPSQAIYYVLAEFDGEPVAVFMFTPQNSVCYEGHSALLPKIWGQGAEIAVMVQRWLFENSPAQRIVGNAPAFNERALYYAQKAGMRRYGLNPKSYLKNGVLYDQVLVGVSKEDVCR